MNAEELIEEVIDIVDDPDYADTEAILKYLNQAQKKLAGILFLPDLEDGYSTVDTVTDGYEVALPATYHKGLYLAKVDGKEVNIHKDIKSFSLVYGVPTTDTEAVTDVCARAKTLLYQAVPATAASIELFFYRLPVDMIEKTTSFPDGIQNNDNFDWALIHDAAAKICNRIEDGMEGAKVNTAKHESLFAEKVSLLDMYAEGIGKSFATRPSTNIPWLGVV